MRKADRVIAGLATIFLAASLSACAGGGAVATVNGTTITKAQFDDKLESSPAAAGTLQEMVREMLIAQYAKDHNITASDAEIAKTEDEIKANYPNGNWDIFLKERGLTENDVHNLLSQKIILDKAVGKDVKVTDAQIKDYFDKNHAAFDTPDQVRARHILVADLPTAMKVEALLKASNGSNFAQLAEQYSIDPGSKDKGGELGFAQRGAMVPEFDNAIFSQKIGDIKIVKSQFGYHIVQVEQRIPAHTQPLSEVEAAIKATLIRQKTAGAEEAYAHALTSEAIKNGLQKTAAAHHLTVVTTPFMDRTAIIGTLPDSREMVNDAFASKQGDPPQLASTGEGYAVFQVTAINPAHAPTFADWKDHVADDYRNEQLPGLLARKTAELAAKARAMNDLAKAAKALGATMKTSDLVGITDQVPDFGEVGQIAPQLFNMPPGAISGPINAERTGVVAKILDKQEPTPDEIAKNFDRTRDDILQDRRGQAFNLFLSNVMQDYQKHHLILIHTQNQNPSVPGM